MALINTPEQLKPHLPTPYGTILSAMPNFSIAEEQNLVPIIGAAGYAAVSGNTLNAAHQTLLEKCRAVIAPFAYIGQLPFLQAQLSNNGLLVVEPDQTRKAFKWEFNAIVEELTKLGYAQQELLILFIEAHKADYAWWTDAPYNQLGCNIIRNGKELSESVAIAQPHRSYMMLKPILKTVSELTIKEMLGDAFYNRINTGIAAGNLSIDEKELLSYLRTGLANLTMAKAAKVMNVQFNASSGFTITDSSKDSSNEGRKNADKNQLSVFTRELEVDAAAYLEKATKMLNEKASNSIFPLFFNSNKYTNPYASPSKLRTGRRGMFTTR